MNGKIQNEGKVNSHKKTSIHATPTTKFILNNSKSNNFNGTNEGEHRKIEQNHDINHPEEIRYMKNKNRLKQLHHPEQNHIQKRTTNSSSTSDSDSSDEGNAVSAKKPVGVVGSGVKTGMGVVPQGAAQSAQKKKAAAASSSSDSDSSDDEQPASKKPALVKASPSVSKAVSGVAVGGKKVVGKPASSSSDSDSSDEGNAVSAKKPVGVVGSGVKTGMGVVPQGAAQSAQKKKAAAASSSSDSDSSDDEQPASKKPALVKASPSVSKAVSGVAVGGKKVMVSPLVTSSRLNGAFKVSKPCFNRKRRFSFVGSSGADVGNSVVSAVDDCSLGASRRSVPFSQLSVSSTPSNESSGPFRRVLENDVFVHPNLRDNSFEAKRNARGSWGEKANRDLKFTSGKVFKQEKTKKKRGSYSGGSLSLDSCSFKFNE